VISSYVILTILRASFVPHPQLAAAQVCSPRRVEGKVLPGVKALED
jgi:hypothetical protein